MTSRERHGRCDVSFETELGRAITHRFCSERKVQESEHFHSLVSYSGTSVADRQLTALALQRGVVDW